MPHRQHATTRTLLTALSFSIGALVVLTTQPHPLAAQRNPSPLLTLEAEMPAGGSVTAVAINADESILAAATPEGGGRWRVTLFDRPSKAKLGFIAAEVGEQPRLRFSPVEDLLIVAGRQAIQLWALPIAPLDPERVLPREHLRWETHLDEGTSLGDVGFGTPPDRVYWSAGSALYRRGAASGATFDGRPFWQPGGGAAELSGFDFDPQSALVALIFRDQKEIGLLDLNALQIQPLLRGHRFSPVSARFLRGGTLLSMDAGNNLLQWGGDGQPVATTFLEHMPHAFKPAAFNPLGDRYLLIAARPDTGGRSLVIAVRTGQIVAELRTAGPERVAVSPTGRYVAVGQSESVRLYGFAHPSSPLEYVRRLRSQQAFQTAQNYVRLIDDSRLTPRSKGELLSEAGREPPGRELQTALSRLQLAEQQGAGDSIHYWANQVTALQPGHPDAVAALRRLRKLEEAQVLQQARDAYNLGQHRVAISLLSSRIREDSESYTAALELIRKAEAKRSLQTVLLQAREKMNLGDHEAAEALVNEALRRDPEHASALALKEEIANQSGEFRGKLYATVIGIVLAMGLAGFVAHRFRRQLAPYFRKLRLEEEEPLAGPSRRPDPRAFAGTRQATEPRQPAGFPSPGVRAPASQVARRKVVEELLAAAEDSMRRGRLADAHRRHTADLMALEAELHSIHRRIADPTAELGAIHNRLKAIHGQLRAMKFEPPKQALTAVGEPTYYDLLHLTPEATGEEIRAAYHELLKQYHPDLHNSSQFQWVKAESERMSRSISEAYDVLSDEPSRASYDRGMRRGRRPAE